MLCPGYSELLALHNEYMFFEKGERLIGSSTQGRQSSPSGAFADQTGLSLPPVTLATDLCLLRPLRRLGAGRDGPVYDTGRGMVLKYSWLHGGLLSSLKSLDTKGDALRNEYAVQRKLFDAGMPVSEPLGIVNAPIPTDVLQASLRRTAPALAMRKIEGRAVEWKRLDPETYKEITSQWEAAKKIAESVCILGGDADETANKIWDHRNRRLYWIDFADWRLKQA